MLNATTKRSSDRNVRSMTNQSIITQKNVEVEDSELVVITDTIATLANLKKKIYMHAVL